MATVWIVPAGTDSASGAASGDYLLRPKGDLYEVGKVDDGCTWVGTLAPGLLPSLPKVDEPQEAPDQVETLKVVQAVEVAEDLRGG